MTKRPGFYADLKLRSQLDAASDSVCRNVAEGFGCRSDREFARFLRIARRSLNEVQDCFISALHKGYVRPRIPSPRGDCSGACIRGLASLLKSLDRDAR